MPVQCLRNKHETVNVRNCKKQKIIKCFKNNFLGTAIVYVQQNACKLPGSQASSPPSRAACASKQETSLLTLEAWSRLCCTAAAQLLCLKLKVLDIEQQTLL